MSSLCVIKYTLVGTILFFAFPKSYLSTIIEIGGAREGGREGGEGERGRERGGRRSREGEREGGRKRETIPESR